MSPIEHHTYVNFLEFSWQLHAQTIKPQKRETTKIYIYKSQQKNIKGAAKLNSTNYMRSQRSKDKNIQLTD